MEKTQSMEICMNRNNFDFSSNLNSKTSGPMRESELLNANQKVWRNCQDEPELEQETRKMLMESKEKRLPFSKISPENSSSDLDRLEEGINNQDLSNTNEVFEDITVENINQNMTEEVFQDFGEEPTPNQSVPAPLPLIDYKAARDEKKRR